MKESKEKVIESLHEINARVAKGDELIEVHRGKIITIQLAKKIYELIKGRYDLYQLRLSDNSALIVLWRSIGPDGKNIKNQLGRTVFLVEGKLGNGLPMDEALILTRRKALNSHNMPIKKKAKKMDPSLVASKQKYEPSSVCKVVKGPDGKNLKMAVLKEVMVLIASKRKNYKKGDMARSRAQIYAELESMGYTVPKKRGKK